MEGGDVSILGGEGGGWWAWYCGVGREGIPKVVHMFYGGEESVKMRLAYRYKDSIRYWTRVPARLLSEPQEVKKCPVCLGRKKGEYVMEDLVITQVCLECNGVGRVEYDPNENIINPELPDDPGMAKALQEYDEWLAQQR